MGHYLLLAVVIIMILLMFGQVYIAIIQYLLDSTIFYYLLLITVITIIIYILGNAFIITFQRAYNDNDDKTNESPLLRGIYAILWGIVVLIILGVKVIYQ